MARLVVILASKRLRETFLKLGHTCPKFYPD